jgi:hypothetical protein
MSDDPYDSHSDPMAPPKAPCECWCLHCRRIFMSDQMWFQKVINDPAGFPGFWMCPTNNCGGAGFQFDIFPTDPDHPANEGWHTFGDDDSADEEFDEDDSEVADESGEFKQQPFEFPEEEDFEDDDIEGEEWKYGIDPFAPVEESPQMIEQQRRMEEQEAKYDAPDERPRVLDWKDREDQRRGAGGGEFREDDIPF